MKQGVSIMYGNSLAGMKSRSLLKREAFDRMIEAPSLDEAVKVLYENDYGGGMTLENAYVFDEILKAEENILLEFFRDMCAVEACTECFLLPYDYRNAKSAMKSKYMRIMPTVQDALSGIFDAGRLMTDIQTEKYEEYTACMIRGLEETDRLFAEGKRTPEIIDNILDVSMYNDIMQRVKKVRSSLLEEYFKKEIDCLNILSGFRAEYAGVKDDPYVPGGYVSEEVLKGLHGEEIGKPAEESIAQFGYEKLLTECREGVGTGAFYKAEAEIYRIKREVIIRGKDDLDTIVPLAAYFLTKKNEIANLRLILVCKKGGIDNAVIRERLKAGYV